MQNLTAFGQVSIGNLELILSGPGASGSRPMADGRPQEPGGWNQVVQVQDLQVRIADLKKAEVRFRNEMKVGPGGKQIQIEDPDANPIDLFDPALLRIRWRFENHSELLLQARRQAWRRLLLRSCQLRAVPRL